MNSSLNGSGPSSAANPQLAPTAEAHQWGNSYTGTKAQLIAAGHLKDGQFPGDPGRGKVMVTYRPGGEFSSRVVVRRKSSATFVAEIYITEAESRERRQREEDRKVAAEQLQIAAKFDRAADEAEKALRELSADEVAFRKEAGAMLWKSWQAVELAYGRRDKPHPTGFRYSASAVRMVEGLVHAAIWALEDEGDVLFDEAVRNAFVREARVAAARHDYPMQRMLKSVMATVVQGGAA